MSVTATFRIPAPVSRPSPRGKVLLVSTNFGIGGGAEEQVSSLALGLGSRGWQVRLVSMLPPSGPVSAEFAQAGIPFTTLGMRRGLPDPRAVFALRSVINAFQPDIVHSHMTHANLLARITRPMCQVPALISTLHGLRMFGVNKRFTLLRELGHRLTDKWSDATTTICEAAADSYRQCGAVPADKISVVFNGVDTSVYKPNPEARIHLRKALGVADEFVWLAAGRLEKPKAYPVMIDAFAAATRDCQRPQRLFICGSGSLASSIQSHIARLRMGANITMLGLRRDIPDLMSAADGFVLSSETEGLPMVLLQAAASQLPIVATAVGGIAEVVRDGETGFAVEPNAPSALGAAMRRLAGMGAQDRQRMGEAARKLANQRFSNQTVLDQWETMYAQLLARARPQDPTPSETPRNNYL